MKKEDPYYAYSNRYDGGNRISINGGSDLTYNDGCDGTRFMNESCQMEYNNYIFAGPVQADLVCY